MLVEPNSATAMVVSLHVHGDKSARPMVGHQELHLVTDQGIVEDTRYFGRKSRITDATSAAGDAQRTGDHCRHVVVLVLKSIPPGVVRSNIETQGVALCRGWAKKSPLAPPSFAFTRHERPAVKWMPSVPGCAH
jgi:hypothetical protein